MKRVGLSTGAIDSLQVVGNQHRFPPHFHDTFSLGVIESGHHWFLTPRGRWLAGPGSIIALAPGETHGVGAWLGAYSYRMLYPSVDFMRRNGMGVKPRWSDFSLFHAPILDDVTLAEDLLAAIRGAQSGAPGYERPLLDSLSLVVDRYLSPDTGLPDAHHVLGLRATFSRARAYLLEHLPRPIQLHDVATHCDVSVFKLVRIFQRVVGVAPHAYLVQLRLNRARTLLLDGQSIVDVAYACGFSDQSHLTRMFKRAHGIAPGRFQRSVRESITQQTTVPRAHVA